MKKTKQNGITLIALVITIIVLLILAAVSIVTLTGQNGILTRANDAKTETEEAKEDELRRLTALEAATNTEKTTHIDNSTGEEKIVTIPAETAVSQVEGENTLKDGLVIIDKNGNEWVWVEVPKTIYNTAQSNTDYLNIEKDMQEYCKEYRNDEFADLWGSKNQHGFATEKEYNDLKVKMLKSVYDNEGFYVARYEVGTYTPRTSKDDDLEQPAIKQDLYPYNFITCAQAQMLSKQLSIGENTTSLMFGIQYELLFKFIETKGIKTEEELKVNPSSWGNFKNAEFEVERGSYLEKANNIATWIKIASKYEKINKNAVLFTSGITDRNSVLNIYDLLGNLWEWTLERRISNIDNVVKKGISYVTDFDEENLTSIIEAHHTTNYYNNANENDGFRPTMY